MYTFMFVSQAAVAHNNNKRIFKKKQKLLDPCAFYSFWEHWNKGCVCCSRVHNGQSHRVFTNGCLKDRHSHKDAIHSPAWPLPRCSGWCSLYIKNYLKQSSLQFFVNSVLYSPWIADIFHSFSNGVGDHNQPCCTIKTEGDLAEEISLEYEGFEGLTGNTYWVQGTFC